MTTIQHTIMTLKVQKLFNQPRRHLRYSRCTTKKTVWLINLSLSSCTDWEESQNNLSMWGPARKQILCTASGWTGFRSWGDCTLFRVAAAAGVGWQLLVLLLRHRCFGLLHDHGIHCHLLNLETLRETEGGGCYSNGSQQAALGPIGPSWRHQNQF